MFRDRAAQFVGRLGWPLALDARGREIDQYDALRPTYVVCTDAGGRHQGSLRLLPTTGRTMMGENFPGLAPEGFRRPGVMECTRYCIAPGAPAHVSAALFLGVLELGLDRGWSGSYGVFDARMMRVYERLGTPARLVSRLGEGREALCLGYFDFDPALREGLARRAGEERVLLAA
jgi:acyl homoserine lactone synthase